MATFTNRLNELIGDDYTSIAANSQYDFFNAAIAEVADMLPTELLLKYAVGPILLDDGTPTWANVEGDKVLLVTREEGDGGPHVYAFTTTGGTTSLVLYPIPTATEGAKVYYFNYPTLSDLAVSTITGFPTQVLSALCYKAAANLLSTYISDFVQDEEDSEMLTLLSNQLQVLMSQFQAEMARFTEPDATPKGE
jgi:hypothetical protein